MDIEAIKHEVIYSDSQSRIFEISVELTEEISRLHIDLVKADKVLDRTEIKGKISVLNCLQNIIDKRMGDVKSFLKNNSERKEMLDHRQFRIAAELVLTRDTYARISELSVMNYKKFKDQKSALKSHKLE